MDEKAGPYPINVSIFTISHHRTEGQCIESPTTPGSNIGQHSQLHKEMVSLT